MSKALKIIAVTLAACSVLLALKAVFSAATNPYAVQGWVFTFVTIVAAGWAFNDATETKESLRFPIIAICISIMSLVVGATIELGLGYFEKTLENTTTDAEHKGDQMHSTEKALGIK
ncbi:hypothetical protein HFN68_32270 [Rhizobium laguerreae]|uniref:hypothetical protein n=1 Tax=Rhizobium laguerreae TaxID=1076926 RepID=UPI001C92ABC4|nr:hypothetical protein [Rhizobium laguerreae]MBY3537522.1 hypothetical protein [Rhizobium laguerreae]